MDETVKVQIKGFAMGRVGLGMAAVLAPGLVLRMLLGQAHAGAAIRMLTRMVGARDIALGLGVVFALNHGTPVRGWLEAGAVADSGDAFATLLAFRRLPPLAALANLVASGGGAAYGRYLASSLPPSADSADAPAALIGDGSASASHAVP